MFLNQERGEIVFLVAFLVAVVAGTAAQLNNKDKEIENIERKMLEQRHYLKYHPGDVDKENFLKEELKKSRHYKIQQ